MGRPKALLRVEGETFLRRTIEALRGGGCDPVLVVVSGRPGDEGAAAAADAAKRAGARVLANPAPGEGPITSLRMAIASLGDSVGGLAYLPVDHPLVRPETVGALLTAARAKRAALTIPTHRGERGHPAVFAAALFPELADPALEGGARTVVHRHLEGALLVEVDDAGVITDIDTPEAYAAVVG
jgi:CTP:molybdopterin cytidylyltransferase MocA